MTTTALSEDLNRARKAARFVAALDEMDLSYSSAGVMAEMLANMDRAWWAELASQNGERLPSETTRSWIIATYEGRAQRLGGTHPDGDHADLGPVSIDARPVSE